MCQTLNVLVFISLTLYFRYLCTVTLQQVSGFDTYRSRKEQALKNCLSCLCIYGIIVGKFCCINSKLFIHNGNKKCIYPGN